MPREPETPLFKRLTRLFRSGPIVKRKIKDMKAPSISSAKSVFARMPSNVYANALNSYGAYDRMCVDVETRIPVPGAAGTMSMTELIAAYPDGEKFIVYAYDHEKKQVVPAWAHHPRSSGKRETVRVEFDDGSSLICTSDHPCMLRDGTYRDAGLLSTGDRMMPFYRKSFAGTGNRGGKKLEGYRSVYTMAKQTWRGWTAEHKLIAEWNEGRRVIPSVDEVHHRDFNPENNSPENLVIMRAEDHRRLHAEIMSRRLQDPGVYKRMIEGVQRAWDADDGSRRAKVAEFNRKASTREKRRAYLTVNNPSHDPAIVSSNLAKRAVTHARKFVDFVSTPRDEIIRRLDCEFDGDIIRFAESEHIGPTVAVSWLRKIGVDRQFDTGQKASPAFVKYWSGKKRSQADKFKRRKHRYPLIEEIIEAAPHCDFKIAEVARALLTTPGILRASILAAGHVGWVDFKRSYENHAVVSVTSHGVVETADMTVDGYENFATSTIFVHNSRYSDFSEMESEPLISAALDLYSDETVSQDDKGQVLHIYSENPKIKEVLEDLFYETVNVEFNLTPWVRNLCKFGDFFLFADVHPEYGIINLFPIPVNEMEREEGYDPNDPFAVRFRWATQGNVSLQNWQVIHFRLMGNDAFLPYGTSVLDAARRVWRQLVLIEDAMLVYRVVRSPERRVFYIDVGNVAAEDIPVYMEQAQATLKKNQVIDKVTGRVDLRYNPLCYFATTNIIFCDGTSHTVEEIASDWDRYSGSWVWSLDGAHRPVPSRMIWAGQTQAEAEFIEVTLDDGQVIRTTPEHKWLLRDGSSCEASALAPDMAVMPFYQRVATELTSRHGNYDNFYTETYSPDEGRWHSTHRTVGLWKYGECQWPDILHHVSHVKYDNSPDNLIKMSQSEHARLHSDLIIRYNTSKTGRATSKRTMRRTWAKGKISGETQRKLWQDPTVRQKRIDALTFKTDTRLIYFIGLALAELTTSAREHQVLSWLNSHKEFKAYLEELNPGFRNGNSDCMNKTQFLKHIRAQNFKDLRAVKDFYTANLAPWDRVLQACSEDSRTTLKELARKFNISRYDLGRLVASHGMTLKQFEKQHLSGGYYGHAIDVTCQRCGNKFAVSESGALRKYCSRKCYFNHGSAGIEISAKECGQQEYRNHRIVSVQHMTGLHPAYGVTVENSTHVVAIAGESPRTLRNSSVVTSGVFIHQSVDEDYFIPVRGNDTGTKIDSLAGGTNVSAIEDVEYIQKKLFGALKVPKAYLGYDDALSCLTSNMAIPLLDGRTVTVGWLAQESLEGRHDHWTYSCDPTTGRVVPGHVSRAWHTRDVSELHEVILDDGSVFHCTENHPFLLRDGAYRRADALRAGDSLMSLCRQDYDCLDGYCTHGDSRPDGWKCDVASVRVIPADGLPGSVDGKIAVYDLEVDEWHNFATAGTGQGSRDDLKSCVFVHNSKATLAQEDIRFSRTISRIQRVVLAELNKVAIIHLYCHGFDGEDLLDFDLRLSNPSTIAQQQKLELFRTQFEIIQAGMSAEGMFDREYLRKQVMGLTDEQIEAIEKGKVKDKKADMVIEAMGDSGGGGESGGGFGGLGGGGGGGGGLGGLDADLDLDADEEGAEEGGEDGADAPEGDEPDDADDEDPEENIFASSPRGSGGGKLLTSDREPHDVSDEDPGIRSYSGRRAAVHDDDPPAIDVSMRAGRDIYNRGRRRTHGASKTHMPDFNGMISRNDMAGPFDRQFFRGSPFKESSRLRAAQGLREVLGRELPREGLPGTEIVTGSEEE